MRGTNPQQGKETLQSFFSNLINSMQQTSTYSIYERPLKFVHGLLTRNRVSNDVEIVINSIISMTVDFLIVFLFYPVKLIKHLVPPRFDPTSGSEFYYCKIVIKYVSILFTTIGFVLLLIPIVHFFTFDLKKNFSRNMATASYLILEYFSVFFVCIQGYLFGAVGLTSIDAASSTRIDPLVWIYNGIVFLFYMLIYAMWKLATVYHITVRPSFFDTFSESNGHLYLGMNFLIAVSHPFRSSPFPFYTILTCILMIFYGCYRLVKSRVPSYSSYIGELTYTKISFDYVLFGIFSTITISLNTNSYYFVAFGMFLYFIDFTFAGLFLEYFQTDLYRSSINSFNIQHTSTEKEALAKLRYAIINSCTAVADVDFLNDIAQLRLSVELIPDLTRICLVKGIDLNDIQIKRPVLTPLTYISMCFLAYQVDIFERTKVKDDDQRIVEIVDEMKKAANKAKDALDKFWTDSDDDHRCILDIRELITQVNQQLNSALMNYPQSEEIKNVRDDYFKNVLKQHSQVNHIPYDSLKTLSNPVGTMLNFLNPGAKEAKADVQDAPVERYFADKEACAVYPVVFSAFWIVVMLTGFVIYYDIFDLSLHHQLIHIFDMEQSIINATNALTDELLVSVDADFTQPSIDTITQTINVTSKEANRMRSKFERRIKMPSLTKLMQSIEHINVKEVAHIPGCKRVSLLLNLHEGSVRQTDNKTRKCYAYQLNDNIDILYPSIGQLIGKAVYEVENPSTYHFLIYVCFFLAFIVIWWVPMYHLGKEKARILQAVRRATAFYEHRCEYADTTSYFCYTPILIYVIFSVALSLDFFLYFVMAKKNETNIISQMNRLLAIGKIGALYQDVLTMAMFSFPEYSGGGVDKQFYIDLMKKYSKNITAQVDEFVKLDNTGIEVMPVVDYGLKKNEFFSDVSEFAQLMTEDELKSDGFQMLYSRYIAMMKLDKIHSVIIPDMTSFITKNIQRTPTSYWHVTIITILLIALAAFLVRNLVIINRNWIRGAALVIRRAMFDDNETVKAVLDILEDNQPNFIDDFPFPVIVRRKQGPIIMCNTKLLSFTPHSKTQIVGQRVEHFFGELGDTIEIKDKDGQTVTMEIERDNSGPDHEIILFKDISELCRTRNEYNALHERLKPRDLTLPVSGTFYNIRHRFAQPLEEEDMIALEELEAKMGVIRIAISSSTYVGIAKEYVDVKIILKFIHSVAMKIKDPTKNVIASLVKGHINVIPLFEDAVPALCGETTKRSLDKIIDGDYGVIYIDEGIIKMDEFDASPMQIKFI